MKYERKSQELQADQIKIISELDSLQEELNIEWINIKVMETILKAINHQHTVEKEMATKKSKNEL